MTIDDKNVLWLDLFEFLSYNKKIRLLELTQRGKNIRSIFLTNTRMRELLTNDEYNKMSMCVSDEFLDKKLKYYADSHIDTVTFYDSRYPYLLKEIDSPPLCLYCKGNVQLLNTFAIGVVGTRKPTEYGIVVTKEFVKDMCEQDITIVSGLASGVDTIAHRTAIECEGKTIAVLAGGLNHIYPASNHQLANQISENNLIISENNPDVLPHGYLFPIRNRIIAGLSRGVLITEAGDKSGALHTINYAIDYNREIFAVPGKINSPMSKGCNSIIRQYSESLVLSADDIFECFHIKKEKNEKNLTIQLDINAQLVLDYIKTEKKTFQQILDYSHLSTKELNTILIELEMDGLITKLANNSYIMS